MNDREDLESLLAQVCAVNKAPAFVALASIVGHRATHGRQATAYRMLSVIGAPPDVADEIVAGWPTEQTARLGPAGISVELEAAARLACYVQSAGRVDWLPVLIKAMKED